MKSVRCTYLNAEGVRVVASTCFPAIALVLAALAGTASAQEKAKSPATYKDLPSEIPEKFKQTNDGFDHVRREVMIPMRDGVKLHTEILVPKGAKGHRSCSRGPLTMPRSSRATPRARAWARSCRATTTRLT
jgi:predicted acyl esterase